MYFCTTIKENEGPFCVIQSRGHWHTAQLAQDSPNEFITIMHMLVKYRNLMFYNTVKGTPTRSTLGTVIKTKRNHIIRKCVRKKLCILYHSNKM